MKKGHTIHQFLYKCLENLRKDFSELRAVSVEGLMYIKEDLIIPHVNLPLPPFSLSLLPLSFPPYLSINPFFCLTSASPSPTAHSITLSMTLSSTRLGANLALCSVLTFMMTSDSWEMQVWKRMRYVKCIVACNSTKGTGGPIIKKFTSAHSVSCRQGGASQLVREEQAHLSRQSVGTLRP